MYDTIVCSLEWKAPLDESVFEAQQVTTPANGVGMVRMWLNPTKDYAPRVTYWRRQDKRGDGRLLLEFSIPKLAFLPPTENCDEAAKDHALAVANLFTRARLHPNLPDVRSWRVSRIDYAWNWDVGDRLPIYMSVMSSLWLGGATRHPYPESGVVWKTKRRNMRDVKFYDKSREAGVGRGVLRFEVSNYKRAVPYMCERWYGCSREVDQLLQPGRALYCMAHVWERLGLADVSVYAGGDHALLARLRADFGTGASGALYALRAIQQHGADAHKTHDLLSSNTYYRWRKALVERGYLTTIHTPTPSEGVRALHLPVHVAVNNATTNDDGQNLGDDLTGGQKKDKKFLWKNLAQNLRLAQAPCSEYLLERAYAQA